MAVAEIRVRLSARIRDRNGGAHGDRNVDEILRHPAPAFGTRPADARPGLRGRCAVFHRRQKKKTQKTTTTEAGGLTVKEPSLIPPPGSLTNGCHLSTPVCVAWGPAPNTGTPRYQPLGRQPHFV